MTSFGAAAGRLAGLAGVLLGWRPGEFWAATPAELGAVMRALCPAAGEPVGRGEILALQEMFPDG